VLSLDLGGAPQLALTKTVTVHPIRRYIEHVDLLIIRRGEKVVVDVHVVVTGEASPGTLVTQELTNLQVEADALAIPDEIEVSVQDAEVGTRVLAGEIALPPGVTLRTDQDQLIVNVVAAPSGEELETEGAEEEEAAPVTGPSAEAS
jgi:large subunit ribosomal protein L25